ncbi:MAG: glycine cleavage system protein H [Promethearchaeota archaeon]
MAFEVEEADDEFRVTYDNSVMHFPKHLYYTENDSWVRVGEFSGVATVGLTDYSRIIIEDVSSLEFNVEINTDVSPKDEIGSIKSKTELKLFPPISGKIIAINSAARNQPDLIRLDNYEKGWLFKINPSELDSELRDLCINAKYYVKVLQERLQE